MLIRTVVMLSGI